MATVEYQRNSYSKQDGKSELRNAIDLSIQAEDTDVIATDDGHIPSLYKKETGILSSFLIVVISGGDVRESNYFREIAKKRTFPRVKLIFLSSERNKGGLTPKMMLTKMKDTIDFDEQTVSNKLLLSSIDKIFMVSDVDHYYNELSEIIPGNKEPKVIWIVSNPCFEIWLYYSCFDYIKDEIRALESLPQSKQSSTLKTINDSIIKGGVDPRKAFERIKTTNENAKAHYDEDENRIPKLYSTNMYVLGEYVLDAIGEGEFENWLKAKQRSIEAYRKNNNICKR